MDTVAFISENSFIKSIITRGVNQFYLMEPAEDIQTFDTTTPWHVAYTFGLDCLAEVLDTFEEGGLSVTVID